MKRTSLLLIGSLSALLMILGWAHASRRSTTVLAAATSESASASVLSVEATGPEPQGAGCSFGTVNVTSIDQGQGLFNDKVEVGWDFQMPQALAALGSCVQLDHFEVEVQIVHKNGSTRNRKENAGPLARNATVRFADGYFLRDIKKATATITAHYKFNVTTTGGKSKDF